MPSYCHNTLKHSIIMIKFHGFSQNNIPHNRIRLQRARNLCVCHHNSCFMLRLHYSLCNHLMHTFAVHSLLKKYIEQLCALTTIEIAYHETVNEYYIWLCTNSCQLREHIVRCASVSIEWRITDSSGKWIPVKNISNKRTSIQFEWYLPLK